MDLIVKARSYPDREILMTAFAGWLLAVEIGGTFAAIFEDDGTIKISATLSRPESER